MENPHEDLENIPQSAISIELPEEVVSEVLDKIIDIDSPGTAFTYVGRFNAEVESKLVSIFENGIIGTFEDMNRSDFGNKIDKETYVKHIKARDRGEVYFNIVDRIYPVDLNPKIKDTYSSPRVDTIYLSLT